MIVRAAIGLLLIATGSAATWLFVLLPRARLDEKDMSVASVQIAAAAEQFFAEYPDRIFVEYDDLVGPHAFIRSLWPRDGEDYHELFPLRRDQSVFAVTMGDGRKVIVFIPSEPVADIRNVFLRQMPNGGLTEVSRSLDGAGLAAYKQWLATAPQSDGVKSIRLADGRWFEISYRGGVPDGPFNAFYADGKRWGQAVYVHGRVIGPHLIFDREGKVVFAVDYLK